MSMRSRAKLRESKQPTCMCESRSLDPLRGVNCRVAVRARSPGRLSAKTSIGKPSVLIGPLCSHASGKPRDDNVFMSWLVFVVVLQGNV